MSFDLKRYYTRFGEACQVRFGEAYDPVKLEKDFHHLRQGNAVLRDSDVHCLFEREKTPFAQFWPPPEKKVIKHLASARLCLASFEGDRRKMLKALLGVFHSIGHASLILRFVFPERFGIYSTPVAATLLVQRPSLIDLYLAYCDELDVWRVRFGLASVAKTEMALWAYHELTKGADETPQLVEARREFHENVWIQQRRLDQVFRPFIERYGKLKLAAFLVKIDPNLAAMMAGREYEMLLKRAVAEYRIALPVTGKGWTRPVLDELARHYLVAEQTKKLEFVWNKRNEAVHLAHDIRPDEAEKMIAYLEEVLGELAQTELSSEIGR